MLCDDASHEPTHLDSSNLLRKTSVKEKNQPEKKKVPAESRRLSENILLTFSLLESGFLFFLFKKSKFLTFIEGRQEQFGEFHPSPVGESHFHPQNLS